MNAEMIQIVVLAAIALFLVLRLRSVLGTRDGFEKPDAPAVPQPEMRPRLRVAQDAAPDADIAEFARPESQTYAALERIKQAEPDFSVADFIAGARQAYEMIVTGFEGGDLDEIEGLLSPEVAQGFRQAIEERRRRGLTVEARFIGVRDAQLTEARFDPATGLAEITLKLTCELTTVVRDASGAIVEGDPAQIRRQTDSFTFERRVGSSDPNWTLVSTGA
jgi:predicted lipid-binding transport protein (Tim44 family)